MATTRSTEIQNIIVENNPDLIEIPSAAPVLTTIPGELRCVGLLGAEVLKSIWAPIAFLVSL